MPWELLPVDYTDALWAGLKKYIEVNNDDGTVSFQDVTQYSQKENSFFGAKDANRMNEALNTIMSMVENGTDLYEAFQNYFDDQKTKFEGEADRKQTELNQYVDDRKADADKTIEQIKTDYKAEIDSFENNQEAIFNVWFDLIKGNLGKDQAGNLQNQINDLELRTDGFKPRTTTFSADGRTITEVFGERKIVTEFIDAKKIVQKLYAKNALIKTKNITFSADGLTIEESV